jgi:16S rRNA (guanine527-N7)-methyltransferase
MRVNLLQNVSRETSEKLEEYVRLLMLWNKSINLISYCNKQEIYDRHIEDALFLASLPKNRPESVVDLGSGNGIPGLILAICRPELSVHLVESDKRKCAFLREAAVKLSLDVKIHCQRVENFVINEPIVLTARAFRPLKELLPLLEPLYMTTPLFLLKGENAEREIEEAERDRRIDCRTVRISDKSVVLCIQQWEKRSA